MPYLLVLVNVSTSSFRNWACRQFTLAQCTLIDHELTPDPSYRTDSSLLTSSNIFDEGALCDLW